MYSLLSNLKICTSHHLFVKMLSENVTEQCQQNFLAKFAMLTMTKCISFACYFKPGDADEMMQVEPNHNTKKWP